MFCARRNLALPKSQPLKTKRLFVSIDLPDSVRDTLAALDPNLRGVRWLVPEQMHLTLSFLGEVAGEAEMKLRETLVTIKVAPFFLPVSGIGTFPAKGCPKIIWIGVGTAHPHLFQLHKRVQDATLAAGLEPDLRPWHPHITLARCRDVSAESVRPFLKMHADFDAGMIHVESFCLNSSALTPSGSVYTRELIVRL
jgi:RNA 2',3'-cyclic 3'-phosphodiesterase